MKTHRASKDTAKNNRLDCLHSDDTQRLMLQSAQQSSFDTQSVSCFFRLWPGQLWPRSSLGKCLRVFSVQSYKLFTCFAKTTWLNNRTLLEPTVRL